MLDAYTFTDETIIEISSQKLIPIKIDAETKYGKKLYDRAKKEIKEMDRIDKAQGNKPSTKFLVGAGTGILAGTAGIDKMRKKTNKKNKNPKLKVKNKKK